MEKKSGGIESLEKFFEETNKKLPVLPEGAKKWIVKVMPWAILIVSILLLPAVLALFGLGAIFGSLTFMGGLHAGVIFYLSWALSLVTFVLNLMAVKGLFARKVTAWRLIYYSTLISAVSSIISLNIFGAIVWGAIELYILFQIKPKYN